MEQHEDLFEYDEDESVIFIQNHLPQELKEKFSNDDILYIVDLIYEFYESKGYLEESEEEVEIDENELISFVVKQAKKDEMSKYNEEDIAFIVQGELAYCESINLFN
jgi:hypothetical protein